jgi:hypothetical protein
MNVRKGKCKSNRKWQQGYGLFFPLRHQINDKNTPTPT